MTDILILHATPAGVIAAAAAARRGATVTLLEPHGHVGGLNTSGLSNNEQHHMFPAETFGGLTRVFFENLARHYPDTWSAKPGWFTSAVFEGELLGLLDHPNITLRTGAHFARAHMERGRIAAVELTSGERLAAGVFLDCSYEGDLLASAGVPVRIGREARSDTEPLAGVRWADPVFPVNPYDGEGLLPGLSPEVPPEEGSASAQVQNINFRITLTSRKDNQAPIPQPARYNPRDHELLARALQVPGRCGMPTLNKIIGLYPLPQEKFECNNNQQAVISLSMRAIATEWITASASRRQEIYNDLREYNLGLFHFLATDPRVPADIQAHIRSLGLPRDEFVDNGHWPYELYVREARRPVAAFTMTQRDIAGTGDQRRKPDTIALGSHFIDCHWVDRYAEGAGFRNEGRLWQKGRIFEIPYRCIAAPAEVAANLLHPVCVSATHVAWCAIRLEPTWMTLGESAAIAATLALEQGSAVQSVDIGKLQSTLRAAGQVVDLTSQMEAL